MDAALLDTMWAALGGDPALTARVAFTGTGALPSAFAVTPLASASVAAACLAAAEYAGAATVRVDRRLASAWFATSFQPEGWPQPSIWDAVAGDYRTADGWIRLHTNARHHRLAALAVLGVPADRDAVAAAVLRWDATALETAVVAQGGCAAAMRTAAEWAAHPQGAAVAREPLVDWADTAAGPVPPGCADPARPLSGLRVLDLTRVLAGPTATRFLAGFGATVLRIDPPHWEEPSLEPEMTLGKWCARLDGRADPARLPALLAEADVVVHGYRPGALDGLGFGADRRAALRPGLVDVSLDAYGWTGPWAGRRGFDSLVQMSGGIAAAGMARFGRDRPTPLPVQALDYATGYLIAAAALRGLVRRAQDGRGRRARLSLARTAALLTEAGAAADAPAFPPLADADYAAEAERTPWGPLRRLHPPGHVAGAPMRWDRAAGPLGRDPARWPDPDPTGSPPAAA